MLWDTIYQPKLFWTIDSGFYYLIFFGMGYYLKNNLIKFRLNKKWLKYVCLAIAVFFNTLVIFMPKFYSLVFKSDMIANFRLLYFLLNILMAFSGIFVVFEFSKWIKRNRILEYLGKHSLNYFALHVLVFLILNKIIKPIELLSQNLTVLSIIYVLITIVALVPVNWFVSKKLPKILTK